MLPATNGKRDDASRYDEPQHRVVKRLIGKEHCGGDRAGQKNSGAGQTVECANEGSGRAECIRDTPESHLTTSPGAQHSEQVLELRLQRVGGCEQRRRRLFRYAAMAGHMFYEALIGA